MGYGSFKFAGDMYDALADLDAKDRRAVIVAMVEYGCAGIEPTLPKALMSTFKMARGRIDMSVEASAEMERKSEAARKAAAVRWGNDADASCGTDADASCGTDASASCKEKRGEEKRGAAAAAASCGGMTEAEDGRMWLDSEDGMHATRREALMRTHELRTGRTDFDRFAARALDGRCAGCDGSKAGDCFDTLRSALMAWDGTKAKSPVPLAKKMLGEEVFA